MIFSKKYSNFESLITSTYSFLTSCCLLLPTFYIDIDISRKLGAFWLRKPITTGLIFLSFDSVNRFLINQMKYNPVVIQLLNKNSCIVL